MAAVPWWSSIGPGSHNRKPLPHRIDVAGGQLKPLDSFAQHRSVDHALADQNRDEVEIAGTAGDELRRGEVVHLARYAARSENFVPVVRPHNGLGARSAPKTLRN